MRVLILLEAFSLHEKVGVFVFIDEYPLGCGTQRY